MKWCTRFTLVQTPLCIYHVYIAVIKSRWSPRFHFHLVPRCLPDTVTRQSILQAALIKTCSGMTYMFIWIIFFQLPSIQQQLVHYSVFIYPFVSPLVSQTPLLRCDIYPHILAWRMGRSKNNYAPPAGRGNFGMIQLNKGIIGAIRAVMKCEWSSE